ncbi:MAG: polysaccharide biosynthesis protein, partial [bacterium]
EKAEWIFTTHRPTVVFHAAAHKHVPLMEEDPEEAIKNNVFGTYLLVRLSEKYEVKRFIFISTDKAVRPTSVMGASKRLAEMIVKAFEGKGKTRFLAVRFGNVLGSRGSVIPLFKAQISRGGPVTVTHPEVTRYFMTIPEAVSLVIQTGAIGKSGELFVLDMGQPVKIVELARNLITLSGYTPDEDIEIKFTGLRPGEKLYEEILTKGENIQRTGHGKIFITQTEAVNWSEIKRHLQRLEEQVSAVDRDAIRQTLLEAVPDYKPWSAAESRQPAAKSK